MVYYQVSSPDLGYIEQVASYGRSHDTSFLLHGREKVIKLCETFHSTCTIQQNKHVCNTWEFAKRVREMSSQLFVILSRMHLSHKE